MHKTGRIIYYRKIFNHLIKQIVSIGEGGAERNKLSIASQLVMTFSVSFFESEKVKFELTPKGSFSRYLLNGTVLFLRIT
jgi:hypothetical protein